jgi:hypothetical protein
MPTDPAVQRERLAKAKEKFDKMRYSKEPGAFGDKKNKHSTPPASFHRNMDTYKIMEGPRPPLKDGHEFQDSQRVIYWRDEVSVL